MSNVAVTLVDGVAGSAVSAEGVHVLLQLRTADGGCLPLGLQRDQIVSLSAFLASGLASLGV